MSDEGVGLKKGEICSVVAPFFRPILAIFAGHALSANAARNGNMIINRKLFLQAFRRYKGDGCTVSGYRVIGVNVLANTASLGSFTVR